MLTIAFLLAAVDGSHIAGLGEVSEQVTRFKTEVENLLDMTEIEMVNASSSFQRLEILNRISLVDIPNMIQKFKLETGIEPTDWLSQLLKNTIR